ncbi:MAG: hypothetical protein ACLGIE_18430, partial [Alphaproteobacteria bacterium]
MESGSREENASKHKDRIRHSHKMTKGRLRAAPFLLLFVSLEHRAGKRASVERGDLFPNGGRIQERFTATHLFTTSPSAAKSALRG